MGALPEVEPRGSTEGETLLWVLLLVALAVGLSLGWFTSWCCRKQGPDLSRQAEGPPEVDWERVVVKALRFIRKRRRISLAWSNYRNHKLRSLPSSEDPLLRQRSASSEEIRPLQEGPAINNGAHRRRTQSDRRP